MGLSFMPGRIVCGPSFSPVIYALFHDAVDFSLTILLVFLPSVGKVDARVEIKKRKQLSSRRSLQYKHPRGTLSLIGQFCLQPKQNFLFEHSY